MTENARAGEDDASTSDSDDDRAGGVGEHPSLSLTTDIWEASTDSADRLAPVKRSGHDFDAVGLA